MALSPFRSVLRNYRRTLGAWMPAALALTLAIGWASREVAFACEKADQVTSQTVTLDRVAMMEAKDQGQRTGMIGFYLQGDTPGSSNFVTGRFAIDPGKTPHAPHRHVEEEVMIVESGNGEIFCDGKTTKIGPGSVMFTVPNAPHGITNTGDSPLVFYFVKWAGKSASIRAEK
jgi:mannose-6-phosphate isomerase-like protein (cupin superfamily)